MQTVALDGAGIGNLVFFQHQHGRSILPAARARQQDPLVMQQAVVQQPGGRDRPLRRRKPGHSGMLPREEQKHLVLLEEGVLQLVIGQRQRPDGDVQLARGHGPFDRALDAGVSADGDVRILLKKVRQHLRQHILGPDSGNTDGEAVRVTADRLEPGAEIRLAGLDLLHLLNEHLPGPCDADGLDRAVKELRAEILLKPCDVFCQGRLRDIELLRRFGQIPLLGKRQNIIQPVRHLYLYSL